MAGMESMCPEGMMAGAHALSQSADSYVNDPQIELHWAMKTYHHAETHFNLISSLDPRYLRLTKMDDAIYKHFREDFPDLRVDVIDQDVIKSPDGKANWRKFCEEYKDRVEDYNFATLIRSDCKRDYGEDNSFIVPRIQFLALEIARNKEGLNSDLHTKKKQDKTGEAVPADRSAS